MKGYRLSVSSTGWTGVFRCRLMIDIWNRNRLPILSWARPGEGRPNQNKHTLATNEGYMIRAT